MARGEPADWLPLVPSVMACVFVGCKSVYFIEKALHFDFSAMPKPLLADSASVSSHSLAVSCGEMAQETTQPTKPLTRCHCLCLDARVDTKTQRKQKHFEGEIEEASKSSS